MRDIPFMYMIGVFILSLQFIAWLDPYRDAVIRGNEEYGEQRYNDAKQYYRKAHEYVPGDNDLKRLSFNEGDADYMLRDYDNAVLSFQQAVQSDDRDVQKKAFFNIGNTYLKQGNYREAFQAYLNSLKIDPHYAKAKKNIEYLLKHANDQRNQKNDENKGGNKNNKQNKNKSPQNDKRSDRPNSMDREGRTLNNSSGMNHEQIKNILRSLQKNPVHRRKGDADQRRKLDKFW
ncbi:MAG: hypothetical protein A2W19_10245 [Spirochaetes bacterium RBG_16_49_21]|nr:MAG: hypothetical protein A2W19_10245 [Spirochaetes bacterium RBG_16_49_21]